MKAKAKGKRKAFLNAFLPRVPRHNRKQPWRVAEVRFEPATFSLLSVAGKDRRLSQDAAAPLAWGPAPKGLRLRDSKDQRTTPHTSANTALRGLQPMAYIEASLRDLRKVELTAQWLQAIYSGGPSAATRCFAPSAAMHCFNAFAASARRRLKRPGDNSWHMALTC